VDPIDAVETRIAEANEALASAGKQLHEATGSLKTARRQRSEEREELSGLRSLITSIKKFATGSN
jgi:F0F1-type ATP synthase membrane subunit b/b'